MAEPRLLALEVRRWGEDETTPIVLDDRRTSHGLANECTRRGCIGVALSGGGLTGLIHLSTDEALRLSDLLRAMASAESGDPWPELPNPKEQQ